MSNLKFPMNECKYCGFDVFVKNGRVEGNYVDKYNSA